MKVDRLIGILSVLMECEKTTAPYLAQRFEVSKRTIMRDVETLCAAGIPVVTERGGGGGISVMEGYRLDKRILTQKERENLSIALKGLNSVTNMNSLLTKLAPLSLNEHICIDLNGRGEAILSDKITCIQTAIDEAKRISFAYYYAKGNITREIEPYLIVYKWDAWYVLGFCPMREDFRLFKLNRMWHLEVTEKPFTFREIPEEKRKLDGGIHNRFSVQLLFHPSAEFRIVEEYGPESYEKRTDGLYVSLPYTNLQNVFSWILSFGSLVKILDPPELQILFRNEAQKMLQVYDETDNIR